jgi:N-acetylglutamate synthase-like GNAT family acetyltransferase
MQIQPFTKTDIGSIPGLQPPDWGDILPHINYYLQSPFCHPIKIVIDDKVVGIGSTIIHGETAWLAHIIVHPDHRNNGIGKFITQSLVNSLKHTEVKTILLIATALGEPVYSALGFKVETEYLMYKGEKLPEDFPISQNIKPFEKNFLNALLELDKKVSGEDRNWRLQENLENAYMYIAKNALEGFYLPTLGEGLIIAETEEAGKALMQLRLKRMDNAVFPVENLAAFNVMEVNSFTHVRTAKRMYLGEKIKFEPLFLYNRVGGQIG